MKIAGRTVPSSHKRETVTLCAHPNVPFAILFTGRGSVNTLDRSDLRLFEISTAAEDSSYDPLGCDAM
jgi:hypothetical protein